MALSDRETEILQRLEMELEIEDPKLAHKLRTTTVPVGHNSGGTKLVWNMLRILAGVGALVAGAAIPNAFIGAVGFVAMLTGFYSEYSKRRTYHFVEGTHSSVDEILQPAPHKPKKGHRRRLTEIAEERWNRRKNQGHDKE